MTYISDCCSAEAIENTLEEWVNYLSAVDIIEQEVVVYGRCSNCSDINLFDTKEE